MTYFTAPTVTSDTNLTFDLVVRDTKINMTSSDSVGVLVTPGPEDNHPPVANNQSVITDVDTPVNITLTASDPDADDVLTPTVIAQPFNGTLSHIDKDAGLLLYSPKLGFSGTDRFTFKVNDGTVDSKNIGAVGITVNEPLSNPDVVNAPPIANNQSVITDVDTPVKITLTANDPDIDDKLTPAILSKPLHGVLDVVDQDSGVVTYSPSQGFLGNDSFTFKVNDGKIESKDLGLVKITVKGIQKD